MTSVFSGRSFQAHSPSCLSASLAGSAPWSLDGPSAARTPAERRGVWKRTLQGSDRVDMRKRGPMRPSGKDDFKVGLISIALLLAAAIAFAAWSERPGARASELARARAAIEARGYAGARVWRHWSLCRRGEIGYRWQTVHARGSVCVGPSTRVFVN